MKNGAIRRSARKILARAKDTEARGNRATASNNLALRNYAPAPKYNAEFPECSHFRARTLHEGDVITGPLPSGYLNLDWVHIEPRRLARGVIRLPELTLQLVGRVQEPRRSLPRLRKIEDEQGEDFGKRLRGRFILGNRGTGRMV